MTPSLRMRVVEAGARRLHPRSWWKSHNRQEAEAALDAMLDCLAENADEWVHAAGRETGFYPHGYIMEGLVAVLREDR